MLSSAATAVDLAQADGAEAAVEVEEEELPAPGRLMVGRLIRRVVQSPGL